MKEVGTHKCGDGFVGYVAYSKGARACELCGKRFGG